MKKILLVVITYFVCFNYAISQAPSLDSYETHVLCPNESSLRIAISNIVFGSTGGDSVYITAVNAPTTAFSEGQFQNQTGPLSLVTLKTINGGATGTFDIGIDFKTSSSAVVTEIIQVVVATPPVITNDVGNVCSNENEINLNTLVHPKGGRFIVYPGGLQVDDGMLDLEKYITDYSIDTDFEYNYLVTDEHGCEFSNSTQPKVSLTPSPSITLTNIVHSACGDDLGEISTDVFSGATSYNGYWSNGIQGEDEITGLAPGDYYYTVTNDLGCQEQLTAIVETIGFEITGEVSNVSCKGESNGEIELTIIGGSNNLKYEWSSGDSTNTITDLRAGIYTVKVIDLDNDCSSHQFFEVTEPNEKFSVSFTAQDASSCFYDDGYINNLSYQNSTPPYTYQWSNGETTEEISGLSIGHYSLEVTDSNGCVAKYGADIYHFNEIPPNTRVKNPTCGEDNGAIYITDSPYFQQDPYTYSWSNGSTTKDITGLSAGVYTLEIDMGFGCPFVLTFDLVNTRYDYTPELCIVTVDTATNTNLVVWEKEHGNPNHIAYYNIYRTDATTGAYQLIDTVHYNSLSVFNDVYASPERRSWMYKISAVNACGQESPLSPHHKTVHLVMREGPNQGEKLLTWDHYEGLTSLEYNLLRGTDIDGWQLVQGGIPISGLPYYIDTPPTGATEIDYIVEVIPTGGGCTATYNKAQDYNSSRSNKPRPIFNFGHGVEDSNTSTISFENNEFKALLYPNPSNGSFNIEVVDNINNQNLNLTVVGINGKIIHQQSLNDDVNNVQLDVNSGIYFVHIQSEGDLKTIKIIVQ